MIHSCVGMRKRSAIRMVQWYIRGTMARKKRAPKKELAAIERSAKREAQKAAGVFDGRYRPRVVKSKKRYVRKRPMDPEE